MKLFVYGTLKRNGRLNWYLRDSTFIDKISINGFDMYSNSFFPTIIHGDGVIHGEIYEVNEETLYILDILEGVPRLYNREIVDTQFGECFIYVGHSNKYYPYFIQSGNFEV